jgi:hypothetical protein
MMVATILAETLQNKSKQFAAEGFGADTDVVIKFATVILAPGADFSAPRHRVPGNLCPFNRALTRHL